MVLLLRVLLRKGTSGIVRDGIAPRCEETDPKRFRVLLRRKQIRAINSVFLKASLLVHSRTSRLKNAADRIIIMLGWLCVKELYEICPM